MTPTHSGGEVAQPYLSKTAVVVTEFMKMVTSFLLVLNSCDFNLTKYKRTLIQGLRKLNEMKHIAVPAVLYLFQNNFLFIAIWLDYWALWFTWSYPNLWTKILPSRNKVEMCIRKYYKKKHLN